MEAEIVRHLLPIELADYQADARFGAEDSQKLEALVASRTLNRLTPNLSASSDSLGR